MQAQDRQKNNNKNGVFRCRATTEIPQNLLRKKTGKR